MAKRTLKEAVGGDTIKQITGAVHDTFTRDGALVTDIVDACMGKGLNELAKRMNTSGVSSSRLAGKDIRELIEAYSIDAPFELQDNLEQAIWKFFTDVAEFVVDNHGDLYDEF